MYYEPSGLALIFALLFFWHLIKSTDKTQKLHDAELNEIKEKLNRGYEIRLNELKYVTAKELNELGIKFIV
ncbi:hypothetical protein [Campylobacter sp. RM9328]|uniref:hypothetical protein n=1 Tax=Campylobacter sp. RM9328 TaxID=1705720 RepID=UPI001474A758|nr:hypothetical protein [Campylobacter sp. RM9328]